MTLIYFLDQSGDDALKYFVLQEEEFELTDFEDYDDNGEIFTDPVSASGVCVYPAACRVIYSYQVVIISIPRPTF